MSNKKNKEIKGRRMPWKIFNMKNPLNEKKKNHGMKLRKIYPLRNRIYNDSLLIQKDLDQSHLTTMV